jgi:hypothetical protein
MNINTLLASIRNAIAEDAAIKVWTNATYDKDHKVYVGVDTRNPPSVSDCPVVVVALAGKVDGESQEAVIARFAVMMEVIDENMTEAVSTTTYKESILALITAELGREGKSTAEIDAALALITDSFDDDPEATIDSNITEYSGIQNIETFRQKVIAAINGISGIRIITVETDYEPIAFFPSAMCDMIITIEDTIGFGDEAIE